jgi:D-beta-D-heptose 7-phosphate kinase/D-beta-D-heptose 1-phosphate adenosyltransferase
VYDITGAGDMVLAMLGVCLAEQTGIETAVQLANAAAGLEVERAGVAAISRPEIQEKLQEDAPAGRRKQVTLTEAMEIAAQLRARGKRVVLTNGCFDLLHVGHVTYLEQASRLGDLLIVAVNSDDSVRRNKGPQRPVISQHDRAAMLAALGCVDYVLVFDEDTPHTLLHAIRPDVLVKGGTYTPDQVVGHEIVRGYGGQVAVTGVVGGVSTTQILGQVSARLGADSGKGRAA